MGFHEKDIAFMCIKVQSCPFINITDPQKAAPCITVIGYNGIQLWQHGEFYLFAIIILIFYLQFEMKLQDMPWLDIKIFFTQHLIPFFFFKCLSRGLCRCRRSSIQLRKGMAKSSYSGRGLLVLLQSNINVHFCILIGGGCGMVFWIVCKRVSESSCSLHSACFSCQFDELVKKFPFPILFS